MTTPGPAMASETRDANSQRAAVYLERRQFGEWSDADQVELDAWLAESVLHRVAYLRLERIVAYSGHLATIHSFKVDRGAPPNDGKNAFRKYRFPLLAAAAVTLMAVAGFPLLKSFMQPPDHTFSTAIGDHTLLKFADGTEIELNTDSAIRYRMTTVERTVWLEKGEAWFRVAHNATNPFAVVAGNHRIADLGTEFLVRRGADGTEVALLNGRAALSTDGAQTAMLKPGDDAIATSVSISVSRKSQRELADELAWRRGILVFRNTRLADVVREFNRYNTTKLVIADPAIADKTITADAPINDYESFLQFAETELKLRIDREGGTILISRGQPEAARKVVRVKHGD
jgi:transmembrane sensor